VRLRDQLTSGARTILLVLMAAAVLVFVITVSNVANLILARTVRRENELSIRAALGATTLDLRRVLLAESLLLCAAGAAIGILIAQPMVALLAQYASRFSVRALDLTVDSSMLWVGAGLAMLAAALLAFVPLLPSSRGRGFWLAGASLRITGATNRRLKVFALVQIAACFLLVAVSAATVNTLVSLEAVRARFETYHVLAVNVPVMRDGRTPSQIVDYYREAVRQIRELPGVLNLLSARLFPGVILSTARSNFRPMAAFLPRTRNVLTRILRAVSPGFFATLGVPVIAGRDFNDADRNGSEPVAIVSQSLAERMTCPRLRLRVLAGATGGRLCGQPLCC
jgi:putative ABC transport system permease protein